MLGAALGVLPGDHARARGAMTAPPEDVLDDYRALLAAVYPPPRLEEEHEVAPAADGGPRGPPRPKGPTLDAARAALFRSTIGIARVARLAVGLGVALGAHAAWFALAGSTWERRWCAYAVCLAAYHCAEFFVTAWFHPESTTFDSFLVNQSTAYQVAVVCGAVEFAVEVALAREWKNEMSPIAWLGVALVVAGQALRTAAMVTAGRAFTHRVAQTATRASGHELVTSGVYRVLRHPGYAGWFWWSVGTQLMLANWVCAVAYFVAARRVSDR